MERRSAAPPHRRREREAEQRAPRPLTEAALKRAAARYLQRFMASERRLREVLLRRIKSPRWVPLEDPEEATKWIEDIVSAAKERGEIDDLRYCEGLWESYVRKGRSRRQILAKLREKGIPPELIEAEAKRRAESEEESAVDPELVAARRYAKQKRLGCYGESPSTPEQRRQRWKRDLARLARRGFSFQIARTALEPVDEGDEA